jgi:hypothetical protein
MKRFSGVMSWFWISTRFNAGTQPRHFLALKVCRIVTVEKFATGAIQNRGNKRRIFRRNR